MPSLGLRVSLASILFLMPDFQWVSGALNLLEIQWPSLFLQCSFLSLNPSICHMDYGH